MTIESRSEITGNDAPLVKAEVIFDIDTNQGVISVASGTGNVDVLNSDNTLTTYSPAGQVLQANAINESAGIAGDSFSIVLARTTPQILQEALKADLSERSVRIGIAIKDTTPTDPPGDELGSNFYWRRYNIKTGWISEVRVTLNRIYIECYTAMTTANRVSGYATEWTDDQQRHYVDSDDFVFRFLAESAEKNIEF